MLVLQTDSEEFITFSGLAVKEFDLRNFVLAPKAVQKINMLSLEPGAGAHLRNIMIFPVFPYTDIDKGKHLQQAIKQQLDLQN